MQKNGSGFPGSPKLSNRVGLVPVAKVMNGAFEQVGFACALDQAAITA